MATETKIRVTYRSIDHFSKSATFKTLAGAQKFAQKWVGETPEVSVFVPCYAVSGDGVGKITVSGAPILDLFPRLQAEASPWVDPDGDGYDSEHVCNDGYGGICHDGCPLNDRW